MVDHARRRIDADDGSAAGGHGAGEDALAAAEIEDALIRQVVRKTVEEVSRAKSCIAEPARRTGDPLRVVRLKCCKPVAGDSPKRYVPSMTMHAHSTQWWAA